MPIVSRHRAFLVILETGRRSAEFFRESYEEMRELAESASMQVPDCVQAYIPQPSPSHFVRAGKLEEIRQKARAVRADILIFNVELTPVQARNIERYSGIPAMDRTGLILDIFGRRAKSSEGKLQVELARLNYALPRIGGLGGVMSRLGGGIGTRGPGEQELEHDRRKIRNRIRRVREELEKVRKHRELIRSGRKKRHFISVALVGYTNAGKSTLLNALTGADAYVKDKLFATLDPMTRMQTIDGRRDILFVDTVGFIRDLPHSLIEAFQATLEGISEADILLHVLDVSHPKAHLQMEAVKKVLEEIGAAGKKIILALNKADRLDEDGRESILRLWPYGVLISAREKLGLNGLLARLEETMREPLSGERSQ